MLNGVELNEAMKHDDGAGPAAATDPAAEARKDPGGVGERTLGTRVFLPLRPAFEAFRDCFEGCLPVLVDGIFERASGRTIVRAS